MYDHFFIAGAQRSGTTYLHHVLAEHPEIEMAQPVRPEPKFFLNDALFGRGLAYYHDRFFSGKPGAWLRGEKGTTYMESAKVAERISQWFPDARIVFIVRDPIERAISNYWFSVNNGLEQAPLEEAFRHEEERWQQYDHARVSTSPYAYLRRGRYVDFIQVYERYFRPDQLLVTLYEQLMENADAIGALHAALGVSAGFVPPSLHRVVNESEKLDATLSPDLEASLVAYYAESNGRLAARFALDLSCWRRFR
ncbi:MAG: sulfotransferase [Chloroflexi bacterium]|nr:sulfotransferase [Chloroflexota bacterium]